MEKKRSSAYTEAFIDALISPDPNKAVANDFRQRRVSAPDATGPVYTRKPSVQPDVSSLEESAEDNNLPLPQKMVSVDGSIPMSYSADDLQQLMDDADCIGPSKWKKFGVAAG